jgi:hypothetical protein
VTVTTPAAPGSTRAAISAGYWPLLVVCAALLVAYLPVLFGQYGFSDDYRLLAFYDRDGTTRTLMVAEGRPVQAFWTDHLFASFTSVEALARLRLINVLVIAGAAAMYAGTWVAARTSRPEAVMLAVVTFTLPSFHVVASVASMGVLPVSIAFAIAAAFCASRGAVVHRFSSAGWSIAALLLLVIAAAAYQPAAMFFWVCAAVFLFVRDVDSKAFVRQAAAFLAIGAAAMCVAAGLYAYGARRYGAELDPGRTGFVTDVPAKLAWFVSAPLEHALNLWNLVPSAALATLIGGVIVVGMGVRIGRCADGRFVRALMSVSLVPLAYLPNLVIAENWPSFRSQIALSPLILAYAAIALRTVAGASHVRAYRLGLAMLVGIGVGSAAWNVHVLFAAPQSREWDLVRREVAALGPEPRRLHTIRAHYLDGFAPGLTYDEFGRPSLSSPWAAVDMPYLALRELYPRRDTAALRVETYAGETGVHLIDWGAVLKKERAAR